MPAPLLRTAVLRRTPVLARSLATSAARFNNTPKTPAPAPESTPATIDDAAHRDVQAPNRATTWSESQRPRALAMTGPRFEQTNIAEQPAPYAAIELIHQQKVRWSKDRVVKCNGGEFAVPPPNWRRRGRRLIRLAAEKRRRTGWSPPGVYQPGQARGCAVRILRPAFCAREEPEGAYAEGRRLPARVRKQLHVGGAMY